MTQGPLDFSNFDAIRGPQRKQHGALYSFIKGFIIAMIIEHFVRMYWHLRWVRGTYCFLLAAIGAFLPAMLVVALFGLVWITVRPNDQSWVVPATSFPGGVLVYLRLTWKWTRGLLRKGL